MDSHNGQDSYYPGEFDIKGTRLQGNLVINEDNKTICLYIQWKTEDADGIHLGYIEKIIGKLTMGKPIVLLNNTCIHDTVHFLSHQDIVYQSQYAIIGNNLDGYDHIRCIIENGLNWAGISQIDTSNYATVKLKCDEDIVFDWFNARVSFTTALKNDLWSIPRREECKVIERLVLSIDFSDKKEISEIIDVRDKILSLISFAIKDNVNVEAQYVSNSDDVFEQGDYREPNEYELISLEQRSKIYYRNPFEYSFSLKELQKTENLSEIISKLIPVINLYLSLYKYQNMPIEIIFLNLIQAIETLHARLFYNNDKDIYVKSVYDRFSNYAAFDRIKELLLGNNQESEKCRQIYLVSRVNDLLIGDFNGLFWDLYMNDDFAQKVVNTRNYYTHYDESKRDKALSGDDLYDAIYILQLLLEKYICKSLGIDISDKVATKYNIMKY